MEVLSSFEVGSGRRIELCQGDLANVRPEDASDLLVVSAFPDNYVPTSSSLIGQLGARGLSVAQLAKDKEADLRATTSCWISKVVADGRNRFGFERLLCYETRRSQAAETVGDLFRAIVPYVGGVAGVSTVAMPIVASGDMARPTHEMLPAILEAARQWMTAGLKLERLRIVIRAPDAAQRAAELFSQWLGESPSERPTPPPARSAEITGAPGPGEQGSVDVFVSYAREDGSATADQIVHAVTTLRPETSVFLDTLSIDVGMAWQQHIAASIDASRKVVVVLTPGFLRSKPCQEELNLASLKHQESSVPVLFPMYVLSCERLPLHLRVLNYADCREENRTLIEDACRRLVQTL